LRKTNLEKARTIVKPRGPQTATGANVEKKRKDIRGGKAARELSHGRVSKQTKDGRRKEQRGTGERVGATRQGKAENNRKKRLDGG